jgi:hypothetical protein
MSNIHSVSIPEARDAGDSPDLNFFLYLIGGVSVEKRKRWMRQMFPKTLGMLECSRLFDAPTVQHRKREYIYELD